MEVVSRFPQAASVVAAGGSTDSEAAASAAAAPAGAGDKGGRCHDEDDGTAGARGVAGRVPLLRLWLQPAGEPATGDPGVLGTGAEPAPAAQRPDPEPRGDGERLRHP